MRCIRTALLAVTALAMTACGSTANNRPDGSHGFTDGMVLDSALPDATVDAAPPKAQCEDGIDNDGDGLIDFPDDPGCDAPDDPDEWNPPFCGLTEDLEMIPLRILPPTGHLVQNTGNGASHYAGSCGGSGAPELIFQINVPAELSGLVISTVSEEEPPITQVDTVLYLRRDTCDASSAEVACSAAQPGQGGTELLLEEPIPGAYFLFVDGRTPDSAGQFLLQVRGLIPLGAPCDPADQTMQCAPGVICASPEPGAPTLCVVPQCNDGLDNDADGLIDYPYDPGCETPLDNSEEDTCPGPGCPQCADGVDNDGDGFIDWPADPGCQAASDPSELAECVPGLQILDLPTGGATSFSVSSTTPSLTEGSCTYSGYSGEERVYLLELPLGATRVTVTASSQSYTYVNLYARRGDCATGPEVGCVSGWNDTDTLTLNQLSPGTYFLFVDTQDIWTTDVISVSITVSLPVGALCDPGNPVAQCGVGALCQNVEGAFRCVGAACNNGLDDDGDGLIDFPWDPGCSSIDDNDEADSCFTDPAFCPACHDGVDNDGDGLIDFPDDPGCLSASDTSEANLCGAGTPFVDITLTSQDSSDVPTGSSLFQGSCGGSWEPEHLYVLRLPSQASRVDISVTSSLDAWGDPEMEMVLHVRRDFCDQPTFELGCVAPGWITPTASLTLHDVPQGKLFLFVDSDYISGWGSYQLTATAVLEAGGACIPGAAALQCPTGTTCTDLGAGHLCQ